MEADENTACSGNSPCIPTLDSIEIGPTERIYGGVSVVRNKNPIRFGNILDINFFESTSSCNFTYQLSSNNSEFYYFNGDVWTLASGENVSESSSAFIVRNNIDLFSSVAGEGSLYWKAFIDGDTTQNCELNRISVDISR